MGSTGDEEIGNDAIPGVKGEVAGTLGDLLSLSPGELAKRLNATPEPGPRSQAEKKATSAAAQAAELRAAYQGARGQIEGFDDALERDVGLGTLRLEAVDTVGCLRGSGKRLTEADLSPLRSYVDSLTGGEKAEAAVKKIDQTATSVLGEIFKSLAGVPVAGGLALAIGIGSSAISSLISAGAGAHTVLGLLPLGVVFVVWHLTGRAAQQIDHLRQYSWWWATQLGRRTETAMAEPRRLEQQLWSKHVGTPRSHQTLASKARARAMLIVGIGWAAALGGVIAFLSGFSNG
jgi:hypothetical protein